MAGSASSGRCPRPVGGFSTCRRCRRGAGFGPCNRSPVVSGVGSRRPVRTSVRIVSCNDDLLDVRLIRERRCEPIEQRLAHDYDARPRVAQQVGVVARGQQGVDRDRHATGLDRSPEHRREVDFVDHAHQDPCLHPRAERTQRVARAVHPLRQLAVGVAARGVDEGGLVRPSLREIGVDELDRRVVLPRQIDRRG